VRRAVVALGANLGDRAATASSALEALAATEGVELVAVSTPIETVALRLSGRDPDAPGYLNAVVLLRTALDPEQLLTELGRIEDEHGRVRLERWGDRTLDLDLIDCDGIEYESARLSLPHPRAHERDFVLRPWVEIEPDAVLPGHGPIAELLAGLDAGGPP